jgi:hypothetical protein
MSYTDEFFPIEITTEGIYKNASGQSVVNVIFDNAHSEQEIDGQVYMNTKPIATVRVSDFPSLKTDGTCTLTLNNTLYYIIDDNPDGTGLFQLVLSEDAP